MGFDFEFKYGTIMAPADLVERRLWDVIRKDYEKGLKSENREIYGWGRSILSKEPVVEFDLTVKTEFASAKRVREFRNMCDEFADEIMEWAVVATNGVVAYRPKVFFRVVECTGPYFIEDLNGRVVSFKTKEQLESFINTLEGLNYVEAPVSAMVGFRHQRLVVSVEM